MQKLSRLWSAFRRWPGIVRFGILLAIAFIAVPALADAEARQGNDWVRITERPCVDLNVLEKIGLAMSNPLEFRAATARVGGKSYAACWKPVRGGVALVYEDGDQGVIPLNHLKEVPSA